MIKGIRTTLVEPAWKLENNTLPKIYVEKCDLVRLIFIIKHMVWKNLNNILNIVQDICDFLYTL